MSCHILLLTKGRMRPNASGNKLDSCKFSHLKSACYPVWQLVNPPL